MWLLKVLFTNKRWKSRQKEERVFITTYMERLKLPRQKIKFNSHSVLPPMRRFTKEIIRWCTLASCVWSEDAKITAENFEMGWKIFSLFSRMSSSVIAKLHALKIPYAFSFERKAPKFKVAPNALYIFLLTLPNVDSCPAHQNSIVRNSLN